jgi:hypothetical protein
LSSFSTTAATPLKWPGRNAPQIVCQAAGRLHGEGLRTDTFGDVRREHEVAAGGGEPRSRLQVRG